MSEKIKPRKYRLTPAPRKTQPDTKSAKIIGTPVPLGGHIMQAVHPIELDDSKKNAVTYLSDVPNWSAHAPNITVLALLHEINAVYYNSSKDTST
jgi:hypothetical protein